MDTGDAALVRAAQAGEAAALGALFERHRARLHAVAAGMLGQADAEDAVQDTILVALRRIGELREPAAVGGWLTAILVNTCRAQLRRPAHAPAEPSPPRDTVLEAIERSAVADWLWAALERLPEAQRLVVTLRHFSAATAYAAIAEICDVPVGTVRSRLHAARSRLADDLLASAGAAHPGRDSIRGWSLAPAAALRSFQRSGDPRELDAAFACDLGFRMADRVERRGLPQLAAGLARDFDDGVTARTQRVIPGERIAIVELLLENPRDRPLHCPPAVHAGPLP
jgi:RNA polymerase sigma-70 factor (ECF subfamily)